jgi:hypothetical protein
MNPTILIHAGMNASHVPDRADRLAEVVSCSIDPRDQPSAGSSQVFPGATAPIDTEFNEICTSPTTPANDWNCDGAAD